MSLLRISGQRWRPVSQLNVWIFENERPFLPTFLYYFPWVQQETYN